VLADAGQVDKAIDGPEEMIGRHMLLKAEAVEKLFLHHSPRAHHRQISRSSGELNQDFAPQATPTFQHHQANAGLEEALLSEAEVLRDELQQLKRAG
jgi:hypothetical protein